MNSAAKKVLEAALKLDEQDRWQLAEELIAALEGPAETGVEEAWAREIERRTREIQSGAVETIPWSAVKKAASARARAKK